MKKKLTLLTILLINFICLAQNTDLLKTNIVTKTNSIPELVTNKQDSLLFYQEISSLNGMLSQVLNDGTYIALADDFILKENSNVRKVMIGGYQNEHTFPTEVSQGIILYIYEDDKGKPTGYPGNNVTPVVKIDIDKSHEAYYIEEDPDTEGIYYFTIDVLKALGHNLILSKDKTYWLVFAAKTNLFDMNDSMLNFNWFVGDSNYNSAQVIDPSNILKGGLTSWSTVSEIVEDSTYNGLAFVVIGESSLGTGEVFSNVKDMNVFPNPINTEFNVLLKNSKIAQIQLTDLTGKTINVNVSKEGKVNTASLPKGVYILTVKDDKGVTHTQKIIKK